MDGRFRRKLVVSALLLTCLVALADMEPLSIRDGHFIDTAGTPVRFWGVNLVSAFPDPGEADAFAERLVSLGVNLVRPHHLMRPSKDWVRRAPCAALALYDGNSRDPDAEAWARFDALNAALRRRGIRLALSLHFSRRFLPGDADILDPGTEDAKAWADAVAELNGWPWQKSIDPVKMLPAIDRRALALQTEFARTLLSHRNPHTGLTYAEDPQVLTIEVVNESCSAYAIVCGNRFPDYFEHEIQSRWEEFARSEGVSDPGDWRTPATSPLKRLRARFCHALDRAHFEAMRKVVRDLGCRAAMTYSNLWRGEEALAANAELGDAIEDHAYVDPRVADAPGDWMDTALPRMHVAGKPLIFGEFGEAEGEKTIREQGYARTELMLAAAAYGCYHAIDGIAWFAYCHGDRNLGRGGAAQTEGRVPSPGDMAADGMLLDHMLPCAVLYRRGLVREAGRVATNEATVPAGTVDYGELMRGTVPTAPPGALSLQSARKSFVIGDAAPPAPPTWDAGDPATPDLFVSDTGQIARDTLQRQLTISSPYAEGFSGECGEAPRRAFRHLDASAFTGAAAEKAGLAFATVVAVPLDGAPLADSRRIVVSRTGLDAAHTEDCGAPNIVLRNLRPGAWRMRVLRPEAAAGVLHDLAGLDAIPLPSGADGSLRLPAAIWHQAVLECGNESR